MDVTAEKRKFFWNRLLPHKSKTKEDKRQQLYSSAPKLETFNPSSNESEDFVTLESFIDVQKNASILFLNKASITKCFAQKDKNKHVQFAPTPMNKCYIIDEKSARAKRLNKDKENILQTKNVKPTYPNLRFYKNQKLATRCSLTDNMNSNYESIHKTYINGSDVKTNKTPVMARTSTKLALVDSQNSSLSQLNISGIYNSLCQNQNITEQSTLFQEDFQTMSQSKCAKDLLLSQQNIENLQETGKLRKSVQISPRIPMTNYSTYTQPKYPINSKLPLKTMSLGTNSVNERLSENCTVEGTMAKAQANLCCKSKEWYDVGSCDTANCIKRPETLSQELVEIPKKQSTTSVSMQQHGLAFSSSDEIPIVTWKQDKKINKCRPFCVTLGSHVSKKKESHINLVQDTHKYVSKKNQKLSTHVGKVSKCCGKTTESLKPEFNFVNPQIIKSTTQKQNIVNKMCKYNTEQHGDGYSSMADDECSFNCSCPSCITKLSGNYKSLKKEKYFFVIEPDTKAVNERLSENCTVEGTMAKAQPNLCCKSKKWYDVSSCETTNCIKRPETLSQELVDIPKKQLAENIYVNCAQIINNASKKDLKLQELFSTPIQSPIKITVMTDSLTKQPRILFPQADNKNILVQSLKQTQIKDSKGFNDSIVLLQEIFQKLSQECRELLQPNQSNSSSGYQTNYSPSTTATHMHLNELVGNLKLTERSKSVNIVAHNIFRGEKLKSLKHSTSLPDLKKTFVDKAISVNNSLDDLQTEKSDKKFGLPHGMMPGVTSTAFPKLPSSGDSTKYSETEMQLLENAFSLEMGISPKVKKTQMQVSSRTKSTKYKSSDVLSGKGKLKLKICLDRGLVTVFVMKATKLSWAVGRDLNCYVKITMVPDECRRVHFRTSVHKVQMNPVFNQKFSFELLPGDDSKRLLFSVWHRDFTKQRSELIGCMSFSVGNIMKNNQIVDGWYRLLREKFGIEKHFAAMCT